MKRLVPLFALFALCVCSCSSLKKVNEVQSGRIAPAISLSSNFLPEELDISGPQSDTLRVKDAQGREMLIMKAVKDENGEMVASDVIAPIVVSATFRNVAERNGVVDLCFDITVPPAMVESAWQLRLFPVLGTAMVDSLSLEPVLITGQKYRRAQMRGYQRYERFLSTIIEDSTTFIQKRQLEIFLKRNLPLMYALRSDSTYVSDEHFASLYGLTEQDAVRHYTNRLQRWQNRLRIKNKEKLYKKYVKVPLSSTGVRLDTVMASGGGTLVYHYVHTMSTPTELRKAQITLTGSIYEEDRLLCNIPSTAPLNFYISSLSTLTNNTSKYLTRIVERRAQANTACYVEFAPASAKVDSTLGQNAVEMGRIASNLNELMGNTQFELDSIVVQASCSPEGSFAFNAELSLKRSQAVCGYFSAVNQDSALKFIPREIPENWEGLQTRVAADSVLSSAQKREIADICRTPDPDTRERRLSRKPYYKHLREQIYPHLRVVRFNFYLHRRGMIKDTIHTTILDTVYMNGVQALRDRDYKQALALLRPYADLNTALAFCALGYNASALQVLEALPVEAKNEYLRALIYARKGEDAMGLQCYLRACELDNSFVHRGNLDPEIASLKNKYKFNPQGEENDNY